MLDTANARHRWARRQAQSNRLKKLVDNPKPDDGPTLPHALRRHRNDRFLGIFDESATFAPAQNSGTGPAHAQPYLLVMTKDTRVLYNETCPICRFEVEAYQRRTQAQGIEIAYHGLSQAADWGLTTDQAARRFHVMQDGKVLSGLPAFRALWQQMPHLRWLAWLTALPVIAPMAGGLYDYVLAPVLYRAHLRRQNRKGTPLV